MWFIKNIYQSKKRNKQTIPLRRMGGRQQQYALFGNYLKILKYAYFSNIFNYKPLNSL